MKAYVDLFCVICGRPFKRYVYANRGGRRSSKGIRPAKAVTHGKICSGKFMRINQIRSSRTAKLKRDRGEVQ